MRERQTAGVIKKWNLKQQANAQKLKRAKETEDQKMLNLQDKKRLKRQWKKKKKD